MPDCVALPLSRIIYANFVAFKMYASYYKPQVTEINYSLLISPMPTGNASIRAEERLFQL